MNSHALPRLLYIDAGKEYPKLMLDGASVLVVDVSGRSQRIPLRQIARAVISRPGTQGLELALQLVAKGIAVHLQDGAGTLTGFLLPAASPCNWNWSELAALVADYGSPEPIRVWQRHVCEHALSRFPVRTDADSLDGLMYRYVHLAVNASALDQEWVELKAQLRAWIQAEIFRMGLVPLARSFGRLNEDLTAGMYVPLLVALGWRFATWRRRQHERLCRRELLAFMELQARLTLKPALLVLLEALWAQYEDPWMREQAEVRRLGGTFD